MCLIHWRWLAGHEAAAQLWGLNCIIAYLELNVMVLESEQKEEDIKQLSAVVARSVSEVL